MPDVRESPEDADDLADTAGDDHQIELLLAGFRACAKEAIRFLLEEEGLAPDHELPVGLQEHLERQQTHLAGMLHNDSGLGSSAAEDSFCFPTTDDDSFLTSESPDYDQEVCHVVQEVCHVVVSNTLTNASSDSTLQTDADHRVAETSLKE